LEQLKAWQQELDDARLALELEHTKLEREITHHRDGESTHNKARDVHRTIIEDNDGLPHFTRANQNIAAAVAFL
jgi:hypothetical protein